jgi:hypothetical protein
MSTPISRLGAATLAGLLMLLGGCDGTGEFPGQALGMRDAPVLALRVSGREVVVQGPPGYCIDQATAEDRASGSFVMLGSCAILRGEGDSPQTPGVLTALVSAPSDPPQRPTPEQMAQFFRSPDGRAALAHDGLPGSVDVLETQAEGDVLYLTVRDRSRATVDELGEMSWRAVLPLQNRLVALGVTAHAGRPIQPAEAQATLRSFVAAMQAANAPTRPQKRPDQRL